MGWATVLDLKQTKAGVLLPIKAQPKARSNSINGVHNGRLKISVTEAADRGKANAAIIKLLSKSLGLSRGEIEIVSGQTAQLKVLLIHNLEIAELTGLLKPLGVPT